ncbi:hypothetical protein [Vibrio sonorensis]|uniref:hypothetical protein n=1 Tax=Vibrio sonorensis TaxID=1004316 RepID=UPI0008D917A9|nr:hypothetical protein [Vibrio sonorensis]
MKAKKAIKKLIKKQKKAVLSPSLKKLKSLKNSDSAHLNKRQGSSTPISDEIKQVAEQALLSAGRELATPLNPILSWFNEGGFAANYDLYTQPATGDKTQQTSSVKPKIKSVVNLPLKSPPCKRCPALNSGLCKCAVKKFGMTA